MIFQWGKIRARGCSSMSGRMFCNDRNVLQAAVQDSGP